MQCLMEARLRRVAISLSMVWVLASGAFAASEDEAAIRKLIEKEVAAWNAGDAKAYASHFAEGGTFTNLYGMFFEGRQEFEARHAEIFSTFFKGSTRKVSIRKLRFVTPEVAIVDLEAEVRNVRNMPGVTLPEDGVLRIRPLLVFAKRNGAWWIETYHNVQVKAPGRAAKGNPAAPAK